MINQKLIENFSSVHRFSGSFLFQPESVPDHSVQMALICINFSELVPESSKSEMCYRCVIHDFEETITSDIVRPIKHHNEQIKVLIDRAGYELLAEGSSKDFADSVFNAKNIDDVNGFLVHLADKIQCFLKMSHEVETLGNRSLKHDFENFKNNIFYLFEEITESQVMTQESKDRLSKYIHKLITDY